MHDFIQKLNGNAVLVGGVLTLTITAAGFFSRLLIASEKKYISKNVTSLFFVDANFKASCGVSFGRVSL